MANKKVMFNYVTKQQYIEILVSMLCDKLPEYERIEFYDKLTITHINRKD